MTIYETEFNWGSSMLNRPYTSTIVLHHRAGNGDVLSIHNAHLNNGWAGIGYHFYVRKDGSIYRGRPIEKIGAHAEGNNRNTIGICFEGNFENESMNSKQLYAGRMLIAHIEESYGQKLEIVKHSDVGKTACPGKKFPFEELKKISDDEVVEKMYRDNVITSSNVRNWELFLSGEAKAKAEYIRTVLKRYQKKTAG